LKKPTRRGLRTAVGVVAVALAATVLARAPGARANPPGMYGFGSRSIGMGSAVSADVGDFSANYYNPGGIVRATTVQAAVGYFYVTHQLYSNGRDNQVDPAHGVVLGVIAPGRLFGLPFAFGIAAHLPDDRLSRSRSLPQLQPRWELYDNRVQILNIAANLAIAPVPWLRIGGGMSFVSGTRATLDVSGEITFPNPSASRLTHSVDADLVATRTVQFGVQVDVLRNLTFGAVYRGQYSVSLDLDATLGGQIVAGGGLNDPNALRVPANYTLRSSSTAIFLPQQAVLGVSWRPVPSLTLVADLTWVNWSAYVNPAASLDARLDIVVPPSLAGQVRINPPAPGATVVPAGFHDTLVPRFGVEWRRDLGLHTLAVRGGYRYDASPVPREQGPTNFMDSDRHVVSMGLGFMLRGLQPTIGGGLTFDAHADLQLLPQRTFTKTDPNDPIGDYVVGGRVFNFGLTVGIVF
jgi:long-chain fatty acid transport protein